MLPAGVKFDPTDQELIEHLEAKVSADSGRFQSLIDLFIPTIDSEHDICYTQPEKLPGRHRSAVYLHKHIPLFIALFFFLDTDLVKQLQFDS